MDLCTWSPFSWFEGTFQLGAHSEFLTFKRRKKLEKIANDPCCSYTQRWLLFVHPFWQGSLIILNRAGLFRRFLFSLSRLYPTGPMYSRTVHNIYIVIDVYTPEVLISFQFCRYIIQFFPLLFFLFFVFLSFFSYVWPTASRTTQIRPSILFPPIDNFLFSSQIFCPFSRPRFCKQLIATESWGVRLCSCAAMHTRQFLVGFTI